MQSLRNILKQIKVSLLVVSLNTNAIPKAFIVSSRNMPRVPDFWRYSAQIYLPVQNILIIEIVLGTPLYFIGKSKSNNMVNLELEDYGFYLVIVSFSWSF
jgi:hypothetical protein